MTTEPSHRERSKARRRAAIHGAALTLFAQKGYDATTLPEIAELAEVSPRTVSLYFPSKLNMALEYRAAAARRLAESFATSGDEADAIDVMFDWLRAEFGDHGDELNRHRTMMAANPSLRGAETDETIRLQQVVADGVAADLGLPLDDLVVALVRGALEGVIAAVIQVGADDPEAAIALARSMMRSFVAGSG